MRKPLKTPLSLGLGFIPILPSRVALQGCRPWALLPRRMQREFRTEAGAAVVEDVAEAEVGEGEAEAVVRLAILRI